MDYLDLSHNELMNTLRRRDNKIKKQAKEIVKIRRGFVETEDSELEQEIISLKASEDELQVRLEEYIDEAEDLKAEISDLLLLMSK